MTEAQTPKATQRNPSTDKQSNEPGGWAPSIVIGPAEEPKKPGDGTETPWSAKKTHSEPVRPTAVSQRTPPPTPLQESNDASQDAAPPVESRIKTEQVIKTVSGDVQEKDSGIGFLTQQITKEILPSADVDEMLRKQTAPTCHDRKCSDTVLSLTHRPESVEKEQKLAVEGGGQGERRTCSVDTEDSRYSEVEVRTLETEGGQRDRTEPGREAEDKDSSEGNSEVAVKIKRPSVSTYKKKYSAVGDLKSCWQTWSSKHTVNQKLNPFSESFDKDYSTSLRLHKGEEGYGRPKEGSKTAERARRAEQHIHGEISDLCYVIRIMADPDPDGKTRVTFAALFDRYVRISDKVVGLLLRARKHGKVAFEGEMLWQGQDDAVIITLLV